MGDSDKFEECKKEIRSLLLPFQKGLYLSQFNKTYREMIGRNIPFREFGFRSESEFLCAIPDTVNVTLTRNGDYHLQGIADSSTKHIQKMVSKQKPAKLKPPPPAQYSRSSYSPKPLVSRSFIRNMPPRFNVSTKALSRPEPKTVKKELVISYSKPEPEYVKKEPVTTYSKPDPVPKLSPKDEVIALVQQFRNRLAIDDVLCEYKRMYNKSLCLSQYGFSSIEECIEDIPELEIVPNSNKVYIVRCCSDSQAVSGEVKSSGRVTNELSTTNNSTRCEEITHRTLTETPSTKNCEYQKENSGNLPRSLREKLKKVANNYPEGIWAADFPKYFEEVTGYSLELGELGYRCLIDLIDEASDIFSRKTVTGSRKDYIIYPTDNFKLECELFSGTVLVDRIIRNVRKILEAYPEGIKVNDVLHVYSINCKDSLHIEDFGFSDLCTFLMHIKNRVPLRFDTINGEKFVRLIKMSDDPIDLCYMMPESCEDEAIPFDAAFPDFMYKPQTFPPDFDFSKFIPAYTSSVANAGHLYIQFEIEEAEIAEFLQLSKELEAYYDGGSSEQYMMKNAHIKVGSSCVAKWPNDQRWYRAKILSIPSMQEVHVCYVDYGTEDTIPKYLLRYAKKKHTKLPAQAVKCRLAFLKPPNNATKWNIETRNRILSMCEDLQLMAKVEEIQPDGVCSIVLCDTNKDEDVYINDVLREEGLAEYDIDDPNRSTSLSEPEQLEYYHNLNPLQALQAKMFLQSFATVAPSFASNENYIKLLKQISVYCPGNSDLTPQNTVGPPGFNQIPSAVNATSVNAYYSFNTLPSAASTNGTSPIKKPKADNVIPPPLSTLDFYSTSHEYQLPKVEGNGDVESEIFDDDEEMFREFCDKNTSVRAWHVKRVLLGDGYKIHVIVFESKPYASSGDISQLIWNNKEADYLFRRLQLKEVDIPSVSLSEDGNEELFQQLYRYRVKGVQTTTGFKSSVLLYPLKYVIKILNIFGHPSVTLRTGLTEEITNFDPNDLEWNELPPDATDIEEETTFEGATDDAKIERLCLHDLLAMKEALACKRKKSMTGSTFNKITHPDDDKNELLYQKVLQRIQEIKEICSEFE